MVRAGAFLTALFLGGMLPAQPNRVREVTIATVNGQPIYESQLQRLLNSRRIPEKHEARFREPFLNELIDSTLIRTYLASRDTMPSPKEVEDAVEKMKLVVASGKKGDPNEILTAAGITDDQLREEVTLPLAWQKHVQRVVTNASVRSYFQKNHEEFDGTKVTAKHIFLKVPTDMESSELAQAEEQIRAIHGKVTQGELTFEEAARMYSHGPSAAKGGDLGEFPRHGKMPEAFSRVVFRLKPGEVSEPFRTPFGVHVCTLVSKKPGNVSLEDCREAVLAQLSQDLWKKTAADLRAKAKIQIAR